MKQLKGDDVDIDNEQNDDDLLAAMGQGWFQGIYMCCVSFQEENQYPRISRRKITMMDEYHHQDKTIISSLHG